jgi:hypothetical protein
MKTFFCNYEHMGNCSDRLTHRVDYWRGEALANFGTRWAYWCEHHFAEAGHLGVRPTKAIKRSPRAEFWRKSEQVQA